METSTLCVHITEALSILFLLYQSWYLRREKKASIWDDATYEALFTWRKNNPDFYVGDSLYARKLVLERIEALEYFYKVCSWVTRDEEHITFLYSLLDEHGPEPPRKTKRISKQHKRLCCFIFGTQDNNVHSFHQSFLLR